MRPAGKITDGPYFCGWNLQIVAIVVVIAIIAGAIMSVVKHFEDARYQADCNSLQWQDTHSYQTYEKYCNN